MYIYIYLESHTHVHTKTARPRKSPGTSQWWSTRSAGAMGAKNPEISAPKMPDVSLENVSCFVGLKLQKRLFRDRLL